MIKAIFEVLCGGVWLPVVLGVDGLLYLEVLADVGGDVRAEFVRLPVGAVVRYGGTEEVEVAEEGERLVA